MIPIFFGLDHNYFDFDDLLRRLLAEETAQKCFTREGAQVKDSTTSVKILKDYALASRDLNVKDAFFIKEFPDVVPIIVNDLEENPRKTICYSCYDPDEDRRPVNTSSGMQFNAERERQPNSEGQPAAKIIKVDSRNPRKNHQTTSTFRKLHSKIALEENDEMFVKSKIGRTSFRK